MPLDTKVIGKDKSNFLIKHSKNLTLSSKTADKDLSEGIVLEITNINLEITDYENIFQKDFISNKSDELKQLKEVSANQEDFISNKSDELKQLKEVSAILTNNKVEILNFPLSIFKEFIDNFSKWNKGDSIRFRKNDNDKPRANDDQLKRIIQLPYRSDGNSSIKKPKIKDKCITFSLPCKRDVAEKFEKELQEK
jgi:hypothetical protein